MEKVKEALEYAICVFDTLHNMQTYQGDNQDFSDEIITMRAALAELEQATAVEPAQRCNCCGYLVTESEHKGCLRAAKQEPAQAVPPAIDEETKKMVLELCELAENHAEIPPAKWARMFIEKAQQIREKLEAGNGE